MVKLSTVQSELIKESKGIKITFQAGATCNVMIKEGEDILITRFEEDELVILVNWIEAQFNVRQSRFQAEQDQTVKDLERVKGMLVEAMDKDRRKIETLQLCRTILVSLVESYTETFGDGTKRVIHQAIKQVEESLGTH